MTSEKLTLRWGIIATGLISSWFCTDLVLERPDSQANHIIQAIGSSSVEKGRDFAKRHLPNQAPTVYGSYKEVYADPAVDIIYIGTPHAFHKQNCLDAIKHGKHVLCEKAFALNAAEAREVLEAAKQKGVFVMEAMWTRFSPLVRSLQKVLYEDQTIGKVHRVFCDFAMDQNIAILGPESRLKNPALGAGSLLDIGIYSLTWTLLGLEPPLDSTNPTDGTRQQPKVIATQALSDGIDIATTMVLHYEDGRQGIATSHTSVKTSPIFCRIEGSKGAVEVEGWATSVPSSFTVKPLEGEASTFQVEKVGMGFYWEADAVAQDISAGRTQNARMTWAETIRVLGILDEVRRQGGARFPQDQDHIE